MVEQKFESAQDYLSKKESERQKVQAGEGKGFSSMFSKKAPEVIKQEKLDVLAKQISEVCKLGQKGKHTRCPFSDALACSPTHNYLSRRPFDHIHMVILTYTLSSSFNL